MRLQLATRDDTLHVVIGKPMIIILRDAMTTMVGYKNTSVPSLNLLLIEQILAETYNRKKSERLELMCFTASGMICNARILDAS